MAHSLDIDLWRLERELRAARVVLLEASAASDPVLRECAESAVRREAERFVRLGRASELRRIAEEIDRRPEDRSDALPTVLGGVVSAFLGSDAALAQDRRPPVNRTHGE